MEVYGIYSGCVYEGGGCDRLLHSTIEGARKAALERIAVKEAENARLHEHEKENDEPEFWTFNRKYEEKQPDYWTDGYDCVAIQIFTVDGHH